MTDPSFDRIMAVHGSGPAAGDLPVGEIDRFVQTRLAKYKCAESYEVVTDALRSDAGKVRRTALRDERLIWLREGKDFQLAR